MIKADLMKNKLTDLNDHLFAALERLGDEDLNDAGIEKEAKRAKAMVAVAETIVESASITLSALKLAHDNGMAIRSTPLLGLVEKDA